MSSPTHRIAAIGLLALPLLWGCAGEEADQRANFPAGIGTDDHRVSQGGVPEDMMPSQEAAMEGVPEEALPSNVPGGPDDGDGYGDTDPSALTDFHGPLDPHGQWIEDPTYGTMWQPSLSEVGSDFAPYVSDGHWAYDDSNYVWVSDYSWGWAPFHYGRWAFGGSGWGWIPGRTYAPSWVTWRTGYPGFGYVGWAPMPPTFYWGPGGVAMGLGPVPAPYVFCPTGSLFAPNGLQGRIVGPGPAVRTVASQTTPYVPPARSTGTTGERVAAKPTVVGPTPKSLNIAPNLVNHVNISNPQLARAVQYSRPSTAMALGAHGPAVGGQLGPLVSQAPSRNTPGGAVAGRTQLPTRMAMPSYGGSSHSYYNNRSSMQLGSSYGHGGSMRSYGPPSATHMSGVYHPTYVPPPSAPAAPTTTSSSHFGGHYGGGSHSSSGGGHSGGGHR